MNNEYLLLLDLKHNVLDMADHFFKIDNIEKDHYRNMKLKILLGSAFYELFFKFKLSCIDHKLIWVKPAKYNEDDHIIGNFKSITMTQALREAKKRNWITDKEYDLINHFSIIRNAIMHFSIAEHDLKKHIAYFLPIDKNIFTQHSSLIKELMKSSEHLFTNSSVYSDFKKNYL